MAGTLYVVATPIGHLDDITLRALRVLREVSFVAAEDTRRSGNLLRHFQIETPLVSLHEHNEHARTPQIIRRLLAGESAAVVTDAGTPGASDPGAVLVAEARTRGIRVEAVPGASAVMAAVSIAGVDASQFTFLGFPPVRLKARKMWFQQLQSQAKRLLVFFESPHRIAATLLEIDNYVKQPIFVFRELTKVHEEYLTGTPGEISARLADPRGEFTIAIPPEPGAAEQGTQQDGDSLCKELGHITETASPKSKRALARMVGQRLGLPTSEVYRAMSAVEEERDES
jgi:16S rRNA (cytidine1402-2'-O)-methyltransferase